MPDSPSSQAAQTLAGPGLNLVLAARAVGLENHRQLLADAQKRTREGHLAMAKAAGMGDVVDSEDTGMGDEMGHLIVTGDINVQANKDGTMPRMPWDVDHSPAQPQSPSEGVAFSEDARPAPRPQPAATSPLKSTIAMGLAVLAGGAAVGIPVMLSGWINDDKPVAEQPNEPDPPVAVVPDEKPAGQDFDPGGLEIEIVEVPKE